jgi:ribosome-binding factor A
MVTYRIERLNREFLRRIAEILTDRLKDETCREAVLTHVDCSRDLSHAKVYYTALDDSSVQRIESALASSAGKIRGYLGREMHIRQIPELHFVFDDSERKARNIDALIERVMKKDETGKS